MRALALALMIAVSLCAAPAAMAQAPEVPVDPTVVGGEPPTPAAAAAPDPISTGGAAYGLPNPATVQTTPGVQATLLPSGYAAAPVSAPQAVQDAIAAANAIVGKPYLYGGGHSARFRANGYDCSGTVSYALHGASLLDRPLDSRALMSWGGKGHGTWITVYTNSGHAYAVIAGLRLDTSAVSDPTGAKGPRWRALPRSSKGFHARHPIGF